MRRLFMIAATVAALLAVAAPAQADPCDVNVKGIYIDLIDCG